MRLEFPSIINSDTRRFIYDSDKWDNAPVCSYFLVEEKRTNSEGWHYPVPITTNLTAEYLASLATQMIENDDLCESVCYRFERAPNTDDIEFAAKVVYNTKKSRYYSKELHKISAVRSKQYDRRYELVDDSYNGSPQGVLNILYDGGSFDGLTKFTYSKAVYDWFYASRKRHKKFSMDEPAEVAGLTDSWDEGRTITSAWTACMVALQAWKSKREFKHSMETFKQRAMVAKLGS
jgi:hypothetical protein